MTVTENDSFFHPPHRNHPFWNESAWFSLAVPEEHLAGFIYLFHRPNMHFSVGAVALWDGPADDLYDCVYYDWELHPLVADSQVFDFSHDGGLTVETLKSMESYRIQYHGGGIGYSGDYNCDLDLTWRSFLAPHAVDLGEYERTWLGQNYQQLGRVGGHVTVRGRDYAVDSFSIRDQSWGPRRPSHVSRSSFTWAIASELEAFVVWCASPLPDDDDPIVGATDELLNGFYLKDGELSTLDAAERRVLKRRPDGLPSRVEVTGTDRLGRQLHAVGTCHSQLRMTDYPHVYINWALTEWEFGKTAAWGEEHDCFPHQMARRFFRSLK